jgi:hypothetical protein
MAQHAHSDVIYNQRLAKGLFHKVPVLMGTNQNETLTFSMDVTSPLHNQVPPQLSPRSN